MRTLRPRCKIECAPCVLECLVSLDCEVSVVLARNDAGECVCFPVGENHHENGILEMTIVPARVNAELASRAQAQAVAVAEKLRLRGDTWRGVFCL